MSNIYKDIVKQSLPRLINLYNLDLLSQKVGNGDRSFHGWKTQDFSNGTFLGGIHTLAIAYKLELLDPTFDIIKITELIFDSIPQYSAKNGSLGEAYPNENSFCVTALAAFDLLSSLKYLEKYFGTEKTLILAQKCQPLIQFISKHGEEHAIISNHLATGVAAIALWNHFTGDNNKRHLELLEAIYRHQSIEGWYMEYEGADPGYQTLCTYYLEAAQEYLKDDSLEASLQKSIDYLSYFIHPDGTLGGLYGSRNTQVYYPGGLERRKDEISKSISFKMGIGIKEGYNILPQSIDIGNYIPLLNSYAYAAINHRSSDETVQELPYHKLFSKTFRLAGIHIHSNATYYAIINYKKGGVIKVFNKNNSRLDIEDGGIAGILKNKHFSTQQYQDLTFDKNTLISSFYLMNESYPNAFTTLILRSMSLSIFKSVRLGNMFKKMIVKKLMTGKNKIGGQVEREFVFKEDRINVFEVLEAPKGSINIGHSGVFRSVHMASSTYNPKNTWIPLKKELVQFISK